MKDNLQQAEKRAYLLQIGPLLYLDERQPLPLQQAEKRAYLQ